MEKRIERLLLLLLFLIVLAVNVSVVGGGFLWDDFSLIHVNPDIKSLKNIPSFFTRNFWSFGGRGGIKGYYRPIISISYAIDYALYKLKPWGYHLTNLLFHLFVVIFLFYLVKKVEEDAFLAFFAAALFGVNPFIRESVAWIAGRTDVIAGFFFMAGLYSFALYVEDRKNIHLLLSFLLFSLSCLSKEVGFIFPAAILALLIYKEKFEKRHLFSFFGSVLLAGGLFLLRSIFASQFPLHYERCSRAFAHLFETMGYYLSLIVFNPQVIPLANPVAVLGSIKYRIIGILFLALLFLFVLRKTKSAGFWIVLAFLSLIPSLGPLFATSPTPIALRFIYLASAFGAVFLVVVLSRLLGMMKASVILIPIIALYSWNTIKVNMIYMSQRNFWEKAHQYASHSDIVEVNYGFSLLRQGRWDEAEKVLRRVLRETKYPGFKASAFSGLAIIEEERGNFDEAIRLRKKALKYSLMRKEEFLRALIYTMTKARKWDEAEELIDEALRLYPSNPKFYLQKAFILALKGDYVAAQKVLKKVEEKGISRSRLKKGYTNIAFFRSLEEKAKEGDLFAKAKLFYYRRNFKEAEKQIIELLSKDPENLKYKFLLFRILKQQKRRAEAQTLLAELLQKADFDLMEEMMKSALEEFDDKKLLYTILKTSLERFPDQPMARKREELLKALEAELFVR